MIKNLTMKELPDFERPYEKCYRQGVAALSDAELISVIIRTGTSGEKCTDVAERVLGAGPDGILNLVHMELESLKQIRGIGPVKAAQLKCAGELSKRMAATSRRLNPILAGSKEIASYYMESLRHEPRERLMLVMFDRKNMLLGDEVISIGSSNASIVSPGEIFYSALQKRAAYIVLLHNHPSGNPNPSDEDIRVTFRIKECGDLLGILLMDHIIIGDNCYFSFREQDILTRKGE